MTRWFATWATLLKLYPAAFSKQLCIAFMSLHQIRQTVTVWASFSLIGTLGPFCVCRATSRVSSRPSDASCRANDHHSLNPLADSPVLQRAGRAGTYHDVIGKDNSMGDWVRDAQRLRIPEDGANGAGVATYG